jgi:hypothetical protein
MRRLFLMLALLGLAACGGQSNFVAPPPGTVTVSGGCSTNITPPSLPGLLTSGILVGQGLRTGGTEGLLLGLGGAASGAYAAGSSNTNCYQQFERPQPQYGGGFHAAAVPQGGVPMINERPYCPVMDSRGQPNGKLIPC